MTCQHDILDFYIEPRAFDDTNVRAVRLSVACQTCNQRFRFLGCATRTELDMPSTSTDDTVITLPVVEQFEETASYWRMH